MLGTLASSSVKPLTACLLVLVCSAIVLADKPPALPRHFQSDYLYELSSPYRPGYFSSNATGNGTVWANFDEQQLRLSGLNFWTNTGNLHGTLWSYDQRYLCAATPPVLQSGYMHADDGSNRECVSYSLLFGVGLCRVFGDGVLPALGTLGQGSFQGAPALTYTYENLFSDDETVVFYFSVTDASPLPLGVVVRQRSGVTTITLVNLVLSVPPPSVFANPPVECVR
mmetsp:Transcript_4918/g.15011  ORF Transcript_4918/g.15011 Transcript_4918/m.15011 type:complete len:226 (+) Transcript_4918:97-774(+)|eukprot:CAMPEP_0177655650 /NCGR_PEP_ID=MMETSP0447-20121125/15097_1 /TAXON_ID=0 /ORGANISM="Stygamoeba regulata, Strain BSH-02190019" /LENGTH=225 /DNA_ID=CAMNT_0019159617 /DNA_START=73 /DNA_END=750 /DNA_ORIENTATION=+